jgi:hypothetical protein
MELMPGAAELAEAFARDGVVCVRSALDPPEVATATRGIEAVLANPGPLTTSSHPARTWTTRCSPSCGRPVGEACLVVNGKAAG